MRRAVVAAVLLAAATVRCSADPVRWTVGSGGNGHWYEAVLASNEISWLDSRAAAEQAGGYLATVTSVEENDFVFSLVSDRPEFWWWQGGSWINGPWLGGYQDRSDPSYSEPLGGWKWVSGEPWSYTNWMMGEPSGTDQDYLHFCGYDLTIAPTWDDAGASYYYQPYRGYIVEWEAIPEPSSLLFLLCGLGWIARSKGRLRRMVG